MTRRPIFTVQDARTERYAAKDVQYARIEKREAEQAAIDAILAANPQIGVLNGGKYYVAPVGGEYREGDHPSKLI